VPIDELGQAAGLPQQVQSSRDAYVVGRDLHQHFDSTAADAVLREVSADGGARRLAELASADPELGRSRRLLTAVTAREAAPALRVLVERDPDLVIALLADMPETRATELAAELGAPGAGLERLAEAVEAVTRCSNVAYRELPLCQTGVRRDERVNISANLASRARQGSTRRDDDDRRRDRCPGRA